MEEKHDKTNVITIQNPLKRVNNLKKTGYVIPEIEPPSSEDDSSDDSSDTSSNSDDSDDSDDRDNSISSSLSDSNSDASNVLKMKEKKKS